MNYLEIRQQCCDANKQLPATGLVDLTFGNVSVLDPAAMVFAIKPSGVAYAEVTPESMVILDLDGNVIEGDLRPSSDTATHRYLYRQWGTRGVASVVHTHSRKAVAFAQAAIDIPCLGTTHSDYFNGAVPVTRTMTELEVQGEYEWETGKVIVERFAELDPIDISAVLVRNHGPFAWGKTAAKAVENALALEIVADMAMGSLRLKASVDSAPDYLREKHFLRKHGSNAYYGQKS
jgi:L-ribulose-5-phosphate 4-epimerase